MFDLIPIPDNITVAPWWYVTALLLAAVIMGMAKSGFGGGIGILAVPLTANVLPAGDALAVLLPMLLVGDVFAAWVHKKNVDWRVLWPVLTGGAIGVGLGTLVLVRLEDTASLTRTLNLVVGGICLLLVLVQAWRLTGRELPRVPPTKTVGVGTGVAVGGVSTVSHAAGPIAAIYLLELKLDKLRLVGTAAWCFLLVNLMKLPTYFGLGLIDGATLLQSAWAATAIPLGTLLGLWAARRIPAKPFTAIIYVGAAVAAARMIWQALV